MKMERLNGKHLWLNIMQRSEEAEEEALQL